jgi:hypothetical protein
MTVRGRRDIRRELTHAARLSIYTSSLFVLVGSISSFNISLNLYYYHARGRGRQAEAGGAEGCVTGRRMAFFHGF